MWQCGSDEADGVHEVDVDTGLPILLRVRDRERADVGYNDVEAAEGLGRRLDPRREGAAIAYVDDRPRDVAAAAQVVVRRHHFAGVSRAEADDGPFVEEGADDCAPDATRPSRHQNSFAGELKIHGSGLSLSGVTGVPLRRRKTSGRSE